MKKRILSLILALALILGCLVLPASAGEASALLRAAGRSALTKSAASMGSCYVYPSAATFDASVVKGGSTVLQFKRNRTSPRSDDIFLVEIYSGSPEEVFSDYYVTELIESREYKVSQFTAPQYMIGMSWQADSRYPVGNYTLLCGIVSAGGTIYEQEHFIVELHVTSGQVPMTGMEFYTVRDGDIEPADAVYTDVNDAALVMPGRLPLNSTSQEAWTASSAQSAIATVTVDAGYLYIRGVATGRTFINVKCGKLTVQYPVTVGVLKSFSLAGTTNRLCVGMTDTVKVVSDPADKPVYYEWTSSDPKVATVQNGVVTAVGPGKAEITASCYGMTRSVSYTVEYHQLPEGTPVSERTATQPKQAVGRCSVCGNEHAANVYEPAIFTDTTPNAWYAPHVDYVYENQLMNGVSADRFSPDAACTRAMVATVLYRLAGSPETSGKSPFTDVPEGQWYSDAIAWAAENAIVTGYGNGIFRPNQNITREQFATILYRYTASREVLMEESADLSAFPDAGRVQSYAREAMGWAVATGLINGVASGGVTELRPQNNTTRAQFATIVSRYQAIEWQPGQTEPGASPDPVG